MKLVIGLVGPPLAGKETVTGIMTGIAWERWLKLAHYKSRTIPEDALKRFYLTVDRPNLQKAVKAYEDAFGEGTMTNAMRQDLEKIKEDIVVFDAVRLPSDEKLMRKLSGLILYVTADEDTRHKRAKARRREGEEEKTLEQFRAEERASTEIHIAEIGSRADWRIDNNGSAEELRLLVEEFWTEKVDPRKLMGQARK